MLKFPLLHNTSKWKTKHFVSEKPFLANNAGKAELTAIYIEVQCSHSPDSRCTYLSNMYVILPYIEDLPEQLQKCFLLYALKIQFMWESDRFSHVDNFSTEILF